MKVAIMQPYFFPYIGYFSLIKHTDLFILFDTPQFIRHGWIERNRILKANGEPLYVKVPLKKDPRETAIKDVEINYSENWKNKILAQLVPYKKIAPNYWAILKLVNEIFELETTSIVELNGHALQKICDYLKINTPIKIWSKMNQPIGEVNAPDEWALEICKATNASSYYNPIGGKSFFDKTKYENNNIELFFMESESIEYSQFGNAFEPFLSILDVMLFNSTEQVQLMLDKFKLQ